MSVARVNVPAIKGTTGSSVAEITRFLRLILIELRFSYAWLFMPLAVVAAIWFFNAWLWQPDRRWTVISSNIAQSFLLIGPAGAMWSAFVSAREGRSRLSDLTASMPASSLARHLLVIGTPVVGSVLAYAIGALVMMIWYGRRMTWGGPDWGLIGFGGLVVLACAVIGAAAGRIVPGRFGPVIISGSLFLYFVMSYSIADAGTSLRGWALLAYPRDVSFFGSPLVTYPSGITADQPPLIAGAVVCGSVIVLAIAVLTGSHGRWKVAMPFVLAGLIGFTSALPMTTISDSDRATAIDAMRDGPTPIENPPLVCAGDVITTCLHQIDARDLDEASAAVDTLLAPVHGLPGVPDRIEMRADEESEQGVLRARMAGHEIDAMQLSGVVIPAILDPGGNGQPLSPAEQVIATWLMLSVDPIEDAWFISPPGAASQPTDPERLDSWQAGIRQEAEGFASLQLEEQRAWLEANWDALRAGELTLEDLP